MAIFNRSGDVKKTKQNEVAHSPIYIQIRNFYQNQEEEERVKRREKQQQQNHDIINENKLYAPKSSCLFLIENTRKIDSK